MQVRAYSLAWLKNMRLEWRDKGESNSLWGLKRYGGICQVDKIGKGY